jgi:hypothetical protein
MEEGIAPDEASVQVAIRQWAAGATYRSAASCTVMEAQLRAQLAAAQPIADAVSMLRSIFSPGSTPQTTA